MSRPRKSDVDVRFGVRLKEERQRLGLTQVDLAARIGIAAPTQIAYEHGVHTPDANYVRALRGLGMDISYVLEGVRSRRMAAQLLDWDAMTLAGEVLRNYCEQQQMQISEAHRFEIVRLLYDELVSHDAAPPLAHILKLVRHVRAA